MFKMKNVTVVDNYLDFYANVSGEMLQNENNIKVHVAGSNEILIMYYFDNMYCVDVVDTETYLNVNYLEFDSMDELFEAVEVAYGELL
ncbi:MAG: hypothetical protein IJZ26_02595 [Clostridia bacterium]|nr:hypothetical protein [Clostridia bacterium]